MRLGLAKKDFIRTQIISKKINKKFFEEANTEACLMRCHIFPALTQLIGAEAGVLQLHSADCRARCQVGDIILQIITADNACSYIEMAHCHKAIFETSSVQADETKWKPQLRDVVCLTRDCVHIATDALLDAQVLYVLLAPFDNAQSDFLNRISQVRAQPPPPHRSSFILAGEEA